MGCIFSLFPTVVSRRSLPRNLVPRMLSCRNSSPSFRCPLASLAAITAAVPEPHGDLGDFFPGRKINSSLPIQHGCEGVRPVPFQLTIGHNNCVGRRRSRARPGWSGENKDVRPGVGHCGVLHRMLLLAAHLHNTSFLSMLCRARQSYPTLIISPNLAIFFPYSGSSFSST